MSKDKKNTNESKALKINRKDAVNLLRTLGFKETSKYDNALLATRLGKLPKYMESWEGTLDGESQELVDKILAAIKSGIEMAVTGEEPKDAKKTAGANGRAGKKKASSAKKSKKRIDCLCDALKGLPKSGKTAEEIAKAADAEYVKAGGESNVNQTVHHLAVILPVVRIFGHVTVDGDKIKPA